MKYKGSIPWTMTTPITLTKIDDYNCDIEVFDKSRVYHINDVIGGSDRWIDAVTRITNVWGNYLKSTVGNQYDYNSLKEAIRLIEIRK